uniref:ATP synthase F0 subunit 6 n=1 Tax=Craseoa lathetica TaxID=316205 RepID=UPI0026E482E1|nr:ATP synthase F0 subunit 6 [Craseoa lathetica]WJJ70139.1 ATP synthase F0 subunit 6 [Craseoa lathetica]
MTSYFDQFILIKFICIFNTNALLILLMLLIIILIIILKINLIPLKIQSFLEIILEHWLLVLKENLTSGFKFTYFLCFITLFLFILIINMFGFLIYAFPLTTHVTITFSLAFSAWLCIIGLGFYFHKANFLSSFIPKGVPLFMSPFLVLIEIISNISRPIALGLRLAANLTAGHILLAILSNFGCELLFFTPTFITLFPIIIILFITLLEIGVMIIQAYVFTLLVIIYLKESLILH